MRTRSLVVGYFHPIFLTNSDTPQSPARSVAGQVVVGIETDRGPWVTALRGPVTRCSRSTRCPRPGTGSGTPRRARSPTPVMLMFLPRSSGWIAIITGRSPGTPTWWMRQAGGSGAPHCDLGTDPARAENEIHTDGILPRRRSRLSRVCRRRTRYFCWPGRRHRRGPRS